MDAPVICEVGPRDGLQAVRRHFSREERVELIEGLAAAGLKRIEAVSFVNPKRVPQMADAEGVLAALEIPPSVQLAGLVMNGRGLERALATRLHEIRFVVVASEIFSQRNQNASIAETVEAFGRAASLARSEGKRVTGVVGASFGCPFEGEVPAERVIAIVADLVGAGAQEICLADTIGVGVPVEVKRLAAHCRPLLGDRPLGFHFHNTRNAGYANALAALESGASVLDAAIGGLGGCPFAPGATGNVATEDLCYLLRRSGLETGVDSDGLAASVSWLKERVPDEITGHLHAAGDFPRPGQARRPN